MGQPGQGTLKKPTQSPSEGRLDIEVLVGFILLGGVLLSAALMTIGLAWHGLVTGHLGLDYTIAGMNFFEFVVSDLRALLAGAARPRLMVNLGMAVLMLTPFARVAVSIVYFALAEQNWKYTLFTAFVFGVLTYSLFLR